jgi:hypothetical protein
MCHFVGQPGLQKSAEGRRKWFWVLTEAKAPSYNSGLD